MHIASVSFLAVLAFVCIVTFFVVRTWMRTMRITLGIFAVVLIIVAVLVFMRG